MSSRDIKWKGKLGGLDGLLHYLHAIKLASYACSINHWDHLYLLSAIFNAAVPQPNVEMLCQTFKDSLRFFLNKCKNIRRIGGGHEALPSSSSNQLSYCWWLSSFLLSGMILVTLKYPNIQKSISLNILNVIKAPLDIEFHTFIIHRERNILILVFLRQFFNLRFLHQLSQYLPLSPFKMLALLINHHRILQNRRGFKFHLS